MTYGEVLDLVSVYTTGDLKMPQEDSKKLVALKSAFYFAADHCTALKLLTANKASSIIRMGPGGTYVRMPNLPRDLTDELDIDSELCPAIARVMASYFTKDISTRNYHKKEAIEVFHAYNDKVSEFMEEQNSLGVYDEVTGDSAQAVYGNIYAV